MKTHILAAFMAVFGLKQTASAETGAWSLGLGASSFGPTFEGAYRYSDQVGFRGSVAGGVNGKTSSTADGIKYDVSGQLGGVSAMVDYYPMNNGLRLSGGLFASNTKLDFKANISQLTNIGTTPYNNVTIDAQFKFKQSIAPVVAVGYEWNFAKNWSLNGELGAILNGGYDVKATATGGVAQSDLDQEMKAAQDELNKYKVYPVLSVVLSYQF